MHDSPLSFSVARLEDHESFSFALGPRGVAALFVLAVDPVGDAGGTEHSAGGSRRSSDIFHGTYEDLAQFETVGSANVRQN